MLRIPEAVLDFEILFPVCVIEDVEITHLVSIGGAGGGKDGDINDFQQILGGIYKHFHWFCYTMFNMYDYLYLTRLSDLETMIS